MSHDEDWGPWIEHDGRGAPRGEYVQAQYEEPVSHMTKLLVVRDDVLEGWVTKNGKSWRWVDGFIKILRYRVRRPKALQLLRDIAASPPKELIREDA